MMLPDTQALMSRSPAASPLLNAVKNRNTRDTVRNALERLTGAPVTPPGGVAAQPTEQR
jgi:AsmA protein